jgi:hypothetical protein
MVVPGRYLEHRFHRSVFLVASRTAGLLRLVRPGGRFPPTGRPGAPSSPNRVFDG